MQKYLALSKVQKSSEIESTVKIEINQPRYYTDSKISEHGK